LHPLDRIESAAGNRTLDDLRRIERVARKLKNEVEGLRKTPLVRRFIAARVIRSGDLLYPGQADPFDGLMRLAGLAKKSVGAKKCPDRAELLIMIFYYVREHTETWKEVDALLAPILACVIPSGVILNTPNRPLSQKALYQWRKRRGIVD